MRVLTIGNLYPPHHFGGYEGIWQSAVGHLRSRGHDVRVLATGYRHVSVGDGDEPDVHRDLDWYWRDHDFVRFGFRDRVRLERRNHAVLASSLRDMQPDVVSFWSMGGMSHSLIEEVRVLGFPIVFFVFDEWFDYGRSTDQWSGLFRRPGTRIPALVAQSLTGIPTRVDYGSAGRYVFGSEFLRSRAAALPFELPDTAVERAGINTAFFTPHVERPWSWRVLYVGRLHPDKGIHNAVAALRRLPLQSTLTFAGSWDPRDEQALAENVARLGLADRVKLLGQLPQGRIAELYREHDVLLFPVLWDEPWGLVPLEAMASGCPVIATGRGGSGEYLQDESNCVLAPTGSPGALADAVRRLAGDPELRARVRRGGEVTARLYTQPRYHARLEHHLAAAARRATVSGAGGRVRAPIDADALV